eukprot:gnl/TRDRNA2_/TRDRNA2_193882_c0_seq1.p1 gnl/TRDRNA2_/TRDRNA2_193882_c0~~gnl/TRDRNA2_/TRDRNA2_193882_c0_seq1.p1  ORF type:complete len:488 (-),score=89.15 gnl/TRDRNA2_/TRDRNA2_193882_c0_seq1:47-1411(-)
MEVDAVGESDGHQQLAAGQAVAAAAPPLRGFCHMCEQEVAPAALADDNGDDYECPLCGEACVECPYDSFERWQGIWDVRFEDGCINKLTIDEHGAATVLSRDGESSGTANLVWAPHEHEGFLMRLEGHRQAGAREHLRPEPDTGGLCIRLQADGGAVIMGTASRAATVAAAAQGPAPLSLGQLMGQMMGNMFGDLEDSADGMEEEDQAQPQGQGARRGRGGPAANARNVTAVLEQSMEQLAQQWPGLNDADRGQMRQQLRQLASPLAGFLSHNPALMQEIVRGLEEGPPPPGAGGPGVFPLFGGPAGPGGAFPFAFNIFGGPNMLFRDPAHEHQGVPQAALDSFLAGRSVAGADLEQGWECSICFDTSTEDVVAICQEAAGRTVHAYHKPCVAEWLIRRNECPTCRRTPVVEVPETPTPGRVGRQVPPPQVPPPPGAGAGGGGGGTEGQPTAPS